MTSVQKNDTVTWKWGKGSAKGKVTSLTSKKASVSTKGNTITRNGTKDNPALHITQSDGTKVLKRSSEVNKK